MPGHHIDEQFHKRADGKFESLTYTCITKDLFEKQEIIRISRDKYKMSIQDTPLKKLPFEDFRTVLKAFMLGSQAENGDIAAALKILDLNHSGAVSIDELTAFISVLVPRYRNNPKQILNYLKGVDLNRDQRLNETEFRKFIKQNVGRDLALEGAE